MALTKEISPKEKERVAALAYEGFRLEVFCASIDAEGYDASSTYANWKTLKLTESANGYDTKTFEIPVGGYDATEYKYEMGSTTGANTKFEVSWTGSGAGFTFNRIVVGIQSPDGGGGWNDPTYPHTVFSSVPAVFIAPLAIYTYRFQLKIGG